MRSPHRSDPTGRPAARVGVGWGSARGSRNVMLTEPAPASRTISRSISRADFSDGRRSGNKSSKKQIVEKAQRKALRPSVVTFQSGRRDSNPRHSPWQGDTLPLSYARICRSAFVRGVGKHSRSFESGKSVPDLCRAVVPSRDLRGLQVRKLCAIGYQLRTTAAPAITPPRILAPCRRSPSGSG